jgi:hypothetical protein
MFIKIEDEAERRECNVMLNVNGGKPFPIQMSKYSGVMKNS